MTSPQPRICVIGSSNVDLTFHTPRLPKLGETFAGKEFHMGFGGKGANQAVMAARLGASVSMVSKVGRDDFGKSILRNYEEQGIDISHVGFDAERHTGVAAIVVDDEACNCIIIVPGANSSLSPDDVRKASAAIQSASSVICQLEVPVETTLEAFRIAKESGVRTILNPAPATRLPDELLSLTDICVPNETELEHVVDAPASTIELAGDAAQRLLNRGSHAVIVTLGDRGAMIADHNGIEHIPALRVDAVDPSGAGDAFIGSLAVFLAEGLSLSKAARRANAVAALSVTQLGTQASFPTRAELDAFRTRTSDRA